VSEINDNTVMKKIIYILTIAIFTSTFVSCGTTSSAMKNNDTQVAGYSLKDKKEIVEQKILQKSTKTMIATP